MGRRRIGCDKGKIDAARILLQADREFLEYRIAYVMAVGVVDVLEVINVGNEHGYGAAGPDAFGYERLEVTLHIAAIE